MLYHINGSSNEANTFHQNFLEITLNTKIGQNNRNAFFDKPADSTGWTGVPESLKNVEWIGFRQVFWRSSIHVCVKILEFFPVCGRIWYNFYNSRDWQGWVCTTSEKPQSLIWSGQLAYDTNMSFPANVIYVKYPDGTIDIHINAVCETNKYRDNPGASQIYNIWSMKSLNSICQTSSINFDPRQTYVTVLDPYGNLIDAQFWGRCGLLVRKMGSNGLALSRQYDDDLSITGAWEASSKIYTPGFVYHMDIYRASYT